MALDFFQNWKHQASAIKDSARARDKGGVVKGVIQLFRIGPLELGLLIGVTLLIYSFTVRSAPFDFYPSACVGTWENPTNAAGEPNLKSNSHADEFTLENSAIFSGGTQQIVCNEFAGSPVDESLTITRATLALSLTIKDIVNNTPSGDISGGTPDLEIITEDGEPLEGSNDEKIKDKDNEPSSVEGGSVNPPEATSDNTPSIEEAEPAPSSESAPVAPEAPASSPEGDGSGGETGVYRLIKVASAQDALLEVEENIGEATEPQAITSEEIARAYYSFDGVVWHLLSEITKENVDKLEFDLPVTQPVEGADLDPATISKWADIAKVQVKLEASVFTLGQQSQVYLDGMTLTARYDEGGRLVVEEVTEEVREEDIKEKEETVEDELTQDEVIQVIQKQPEGDEESDEPAIGILNRSLKLLNTLPASLELLWRKEQDQKEHNKDEEVQKSFAYYDVLTNDIIISGMCSADYYTILVFKDKEAYRKNPESALYNSASECSGSFQVRISAIASSVRLVSGTYYILVADQPSVGSWTPISGLIPFEID